MTKLNDLVATIKDSWENLQQMLGELSTIFRLETRLASISLFRIILMLFVCSLLCLVIWLCAVSAICLWVLQIGYTWPTALMLAAGINIGLLLTLSLAIRRCSKNLCFKATRNQLCMQPVETKRLSDDEAA